MCQTLVVMVVVIGKRDLDMSWTDEHTALDRMNVWRRVTANLKCDTDSIICWLGSW